jgi:hypothetical protein
MFETDLGCHAHIAQQGGHVSGSWIFEQVGCEQRTPLSSNGRTTACRAENGSSILPRGALEMRKSYS